jgi:biopolymer transport protein TolR
MSFGRLERTQGAAPMSDINMTPLIDVMLVLLVIFMITAPLLVSTVQVDLPRAAGGGGAASVAPSVELTIDRSGAVYAGGNLQGTEDLALLLQKAAKTSADTELRLRADTAVPYGRVVEVMGLAQKAGLSRIGFVADTAQTTSP